MVREIESYMAQTIPCCVHKPITGQIAIQIQIVLVCNFLCENEMVFCLYIDISSLLSNSGYCRVIILLCSRI